MRCCCGTGARVRLGRARRWKRCVGKPGCRSTPGASACTLADFPAVDFGRNAVAVVASDAIATLLNRQYVGVFRKTLCSCSSSVVNRCRDPPGRAGNIEFWLAVPQCLEGSTTCTKSSSRHNSATNAASQSPRGSQPIRNFAAWSFKNDRSPPSFPSWRGS